MEEQFTDEFPAVAEAVTEEVAEAAAAAEEGWTEAVGQWMEEMGAWIRAYGDPLDGTTGKSSK